MDITQPTQYPTEYPQLIINADDYGYSWERSQGILQLIEAGCISSTSVIVNAPQIEQKCKKLLKYCWGGVGQADGKDVQNEGLLVQYINMEEPNKMAVSIGIHLNFTEFGSCQAVQAAIDTCLIDPQTNTFKGKSYIYDNLAQIKNDSQFIQNQIRAQIEKFIQIFHCRPSHIDGHNHIHLIPEFATGVCKIARLFGIYRVRVPIVPHLHQSQDKNLNKYNLKFTEMASEARKIYDQFRFLYPDYFMGLDLIGKQFTLQNFHQRLKQITQIISHSSLRNTVVEVMVHPGYRQQQQFAQYPTCPFSMSQQRQFEMNALKSKQFSKFKPCLRSFWDLKKRTCQKSILIYSKLLKCCGNLTTSLRLHQIFTEYLKYQVYFLDVSEGDQQEQAKYLSEMVNKLCINFVLGVNLTRTAGIIYKALNNGSRKGQISYKVPYGLVVAGTDANVTLDSGLKEVLQSINVSVSEAECLVSISEKMKQKIDSYLSINNVLKQATLIRQSTLNAPTTQKLKYLDIPNFTQSKPYIVFPTSFRKVKAVHHILHELNLVIQKHNINVYILGPIIDDPYYQDTIKKFKKVVYLHCQPHEIYLQILRNAMLLINCSESEGMSCSILEAFEENVPVIARKNQGNCELVSDDVNGFLYEKGEEFIEKFEKLLQNYQSLRKKFCEKAYSILHQHYSYETQRQSYKKLLDGHLEPFYYSLEIPTNIQQNLNERISLNLLSLKNVHAISPVNLKIFNKFFQKDDSGINPSFKYVGKILGNNGSEEKCINFLDVGCGNGIFTLFFLIKFMIFFRDSSEKIKINLTFLDIHRDSLRNLKVNLRAFEQIYNQWKDNKLILGTITILQSNMFEQLRAKNLGSFDIILANMPQTPFKNEKSRLDKNGGSDGFKLTTVLLQNYKKFLKNENSILVMLYSHMLNESKYKQILHTNGSKLEWISQPEIHKIKREDYDKMEERLAFMIEQNMRNGKSGIKLEGQVFFVPADLRIVKSQ